MMHPALIRALDDRRAYRADTLHPRPEVRAMRADAAWQVLTSKAATHNEVVKACHTVMVNATDARRATAGQILKLLEGQKA